MLVPACGSVGQLAKAIRLSAAVRLRQDWGREGRAARENAVSGGYPRPRASFRFVHTFWTGTGILEGGGQRGV